MLPIVAAGFADRHTVGVEGRVTALDQEIAQLTQERQLLRRKRPSLLPDFTLCDDTEDPPQLLSWHVHVSFHANDPTSASFALGLRDRFVTVRNISRELCPMGHLQPAPAFGRICQFPLEYDAAGPYAGTGPFDLPNFSFFVPAGLLAEVVSWWSQHRGPLSVLAHPNSGCQDHDHGTWPAAIGQPTTLNVPNGLACCHSGPPGCTCYTTVYTPPGDGRRCLSAAASTGAVSVAGCDVSDPDGSKPWAHTNYSRSFSQLEAFLTFPRADRCLGIAPRGISGKGSEPPTATCAAGAELRLVSCTPDTDAEVNATRVSYVVSRGDGVLSLDGCPGQCVTRAKDGTTVAVGDCDEAESRWRRLCAMAPHTAPVPCPHEQF